MRRLPVSLVICFSVASIALAAGRVEIFVSPAGNDINPGTIKRPFRTLQRAKAQVREARSRAADEIVVMLRGGEYQVEEPLVFLPEDGGTDEQQVRYQAYSKEVPVITGGRRITGWKVNEKGIWVTNLPDVAAGKWKFRQLFVNGVKQFRARIPNEGFFRVHGFPDGNMDAGYDHPSQRFEFAGSDLRSDWSNPGDIEVIVYHFWTDSHLPVQSIDDQQRIVTFRQKADKVFTDDFTNRGARYIVENVFEGLDQPGEWYLDRQKGQLYYYPQPGMTPDKTEVIAPVLAEFIRLEGDPASRRPVRNLAFSGLTLQYTNWDLPPGDSNDAQGSSGVPAAITLKGAKGCSFTSCTVRNIGTWAFELKAGCSENLIGHNQIVRAGAGGVRIDGGTEDDHPLERTELNRITDNTVSHFGDEFPSAVGILLMNTSGNSVAHNLISYGWYTGVSVGWVWGYARSISRDNVIEYNHIHHIGQGLLSDMGGIYTLGVSPGTVLRNNLIHDVDANQYGGWGIYNDEGSTHILVERNVVYNTKFAGYDIHYAREVTVRNNIFAFGRMEQLNRTRMEQHKSVYFEQNIVYWTEGELLNGNWQDKPYSLYIAPNQPPLDETNTSDFDWNIYFNPNKPVSEVKFAGKTLGDWQSGGKDRHSLWADPLFVDPAHRDFRLRPESPAFQLGFKPIDVSTVGPRPLER